MLYTGESVQLANNGEKRFKKSFCNRYRSNESFEIGETYFPQQQTRQTCLNGRSWQYTYTCAWLLL